MRPLLIVFILITCSCKQDISRITSVGKKVHETMEVCKDADEKICTEIKKAATKTDKIKKEVEAEVLNAQMMVW
jgi:hypothetical protein